MGDWRAKAYGAGHRLGSPGLPQDCMLDPMTRMFSWIIGLCVAIAAVGFAPPPANALEFGRLRMLNSAEHIPWRGVGRVNVASNFGTSMCTGTLIDEDLVLTAAHCVMSPRTGKVYQPGVVHFVAGWRRGTKVGHSVASTIAVHPDYVLADFASTKKIGTDLAMIRLANPIPAAKAPFFGIAPAPVSETELTLISYRQDRPHALTRQQGCEIIGIDGAVLALKCNVTFGASGSPLFMAVGDKMRLVAVVSAKGRDPRNPTAYAVVVDATIAQVLAVLE